MRKLFITAIVLGLAVAPAAFARGGHDQDGKSGQSENSDRGDKAARSDQRGKSDQQDRKFNNARGQNESRAQGDVRNAPNMGTRNAARTHRTRNAANNDRTRNAANFERKRNVANTDRVRNVANTNRTVKTFVKTRPAEIMAVRSNVRSSQRFHAGSYRQPHGYHSHHWRYGERLPQLYFVSDYWITDYLTYALFAPLDGYVWVRVGDDALLIDRYTGEIIRVEYGVFY